MSSAENGACTAEILCCVSSAPPDLMASPVPTIQAAEAARLIALGKVSLVDVREPGEWAAGRAPEAVHVPLGALAERFAEVEALGRPVVFVCRSGGRSGVATEAAVAAGLPAQNLEGGMHAWAEAGLPMVPANARVA